VHGQHSFSPLIDQERRHSEPVHRIAVAVARDAVAVTRDAVAVAADVAGSRVERAVGRSCSHLDLAVADLGCYKAAARYGMTWSPAQLRVHGAGYICTHS
jgi:hypothetical protein